MPSAKYHVGLNMLTQSCHTFSISIKIFSWVPLTYQKHWCLKLLQLGTNSIMCCMLNRLVVIIVTPQDELLIFDCSIMDFNWNWKGSMSCLLEKQYPMACAMLMNHYSSPFHMSWGLFSLTASVITHFMVPPTAPEVLANYCMVSYDIATDIKASNDF